MTSKKKTGKPKLTKRPELLGQIEEELDLHGMAVDEALVATELLIKRYQGRTGTLLRLIHGHSNRGQDSIRNRIHQALRTTWNRKIKRFRFDFLNPGATLIEL